LKITRVGFLLLAIAVATSLPAFADGCIPYCNIGTIAPTNIFTADSTGDITGFFIQGGAASGGGAADLDFVRMLDITTGTTSPWLFNNQTSLPGDTADFGFVNSGDTLVFEIQNVTLGGIILASDPTLSDDGVNHAYATHFSGGILNGALIPAGTYVGMEDLPNGESDWNYNDDSFVFTGVTAGTTPEPGTLVLFGTGILGLAGVVRRKLSR
jgi:PEP-CTERM motif